jgi:hypothetical protein
MSIWIGSRVDCRAGQIAHIGSIHPRDEALNDSKKQIQFQARSLIIMIERLNLQAPETSAYCRFGFDQDHLKRFGNYGYPGLRPPLRIKCFLFVQSSTIGGTSRAELTFFSPITHASFRRRQYFAARRE